VVGAPTTTTSGPNGGSSGGEAYVIFGSTSGFGATFAPSSLDGTNGFALVGYAENQVGYSVGSLGDWDGDGIADLLVGGPGRPQSFGPTPQDAGTAFIVYGSNSAFAASLDANNFGNAGFRFRAQTAGDLLGFSVGGGDINNDGRADAIVGSPGRAAGADQGAGFVRLGVETGFTSGTSAENQPGRQNNFNGYSYGGQPIYAGAAVASGGDINGDGIDDIVVGAPAAQVGGTNDSGIVFIVFGQPGGTSGRDVINGTTGDDTIEAYAQDDTVFGLSGNDSINSDTGRDTVFGGPGDDVLNNNAQQRDTLFGGDGNDTILSQAFESAKLFGASGDDELRITGATGFSSTIRNTLFGGTGNDVLTARNQTSDTVDGGDGDDTL